MSLPRLVTQYEDFDPCCCSECGVIYYVPANFRRSRQNDHRTFYCPNGHGQHIPRESPLEKNARLLREEQERHKRTLARANDAEAETERLKKRTKAGVCHCCNRTFLKLAYHIKAKHPEFAK